ncbi:hypothetical protein [Caulobacter mirabilis]|uniref:Uncharacterized protein n=1 Tax=Caulobacter mirabilis TaxID=69666 RepID=A0A2D2AWU4_9CAUL|nr:hypothetical protein [Caulobacter mirabilis]ATQ42441.1 hypothetical protein CSW64_08445 [Caulobacter mirabilis]
MPTLSTPPAERREPSPLLIHLAGEFADRVAALWPAPHGPFLTAGAAQRHLIALGLTRGRPGVDLRAVLTIPLKRALRLILQSPPRGLLRALGRLGERAWSRTDYDLLLALLARPETAKILAHAEAIEADAARALHGTPPPLVRAGLHRLPLLPDQAALATEAFTAISARDGEGVGERIARRWAGARTVESLMDRLREDILPELPPPPFPGTERLRPLTTKAAMREAGGRYNNCLRQRLHRAASGASAFYEWRGAPSAVIEIVRDQLFGWRLSEARLRDNEIMSVADRPALVADLRSLGVWIGRSHWGLHHASHDADEPTFRFEPVERAVAEAFEG